MIQATEEASRPPTAMESAPDEEEEEEDDDAEYILITAVVFREGDMWETEFYLDAEEHAKFDGDHRSLITLCIQAFDSIIDESLEE